MQLEGGEWHSDPVRGKNMRMIYPTGGVTDMICRGSIYEE
jgi:hypothetical protein